MSPARAVQRDACERPAPAEVSGDVGEPDGIEVEATGQQSQDALSSPMAARPARSAGSGPWSSSSSAP